jgi:hypothetical protein
LPASVTSASVCFMSPGCSGSDSIAGFMASAFASISTSCFSVVAREPPRL